MGEREEVGEEGRESHERCGHSRRKRGNAGPRGGGDGLRARRRLVTRWGKGRAGEKKGRWAIVVGGGKKLNDERAGTRAGAESTRGIPSILGRTVCFCDLVWENHKNIGYQE